MSPTREPPTSAPPATPIAAVSEAEDVLDRLPYGVVVLAGRRVGSANAAAARLLARLGRTEGRAPLCHELFSCREAGGPCEAGCLAERAALAPEALPEIRIDATAGSPVSALWVTAAPLRGEDRVVLHLRAGDARDRRRRSEPHWLSGPELRISALGRTWVDSPEGPIGGKWLGQRPGLLLKYLIAERNRVVHAEEIADALWPGAGRQSLGNVRHFMHALRQKLEPERKKGAESSFVVTVQGGYALNRRRVHIDADALEEAVGEGLAAGARGENETAEERLEHGISHYRGELIADERYAEWVYAERDRMRGVVAEAMRELVQIRLARDDLGGAASVLERLAELEPYDAGTQKFLLAVLKAQGRRTDAARRYAAFRARLAREFGEEPGFRLADVRL